MAEEIARRAKVLLGTIEIEGFMLSDGSYRMSQTQAAEIIGVLEINARRFLASKAIKGLLGEGYTPDTIEAESEPGKRGQTRFNALPLRIVTAYWFNQASQGNKQAQALVWAMLTETLEQRFDAAFDMERSWRERNERLYQRLEEMERYLEGSMEYKNEARFETQYYRNWLIQMGYNLDDLPNPAMLSKSTHHTPILCKC